MYGDPAAVPAIEKAAEPLEDKDKELKQEVASDSGRAQGPGRSREQARPRTFRYLGALS